MMAVAALAGIILPCSHKEKALTLVCVSLHNCALLCKYLDIIVTGFTILVLRKKLVAPFAKDAVGGKDTFEAFEARRMERIHGKMMALMKTKPVGKDPLRCSCLEDGLDGSVADGLSSADRFVVDEIGDEQATPFVNEIQREVGLQGEACQDFALFGDGLTR